MGKKQAAPDAELDADGLVVQKYHSMVLVVVPAHDFGDECLRYARSSLYNVHVGTRVVSVQSQEAVRGRLGVSGASKERARLKVSGRGSRTEPDWVKDKLSGGKGSGESTRSPGRKRRKR